MSVNRRLSGADLRSRRRISGPATSATCPPQSPTMSPLRDHLRNVLVANISELLCALGPSTYDEVAPKIEYWIEHVITERFITADDLVERLSRLAWNLFPENHRSAIPRFLKEFHDAPNRSKEAKSFVDEFCFQVLRWFTAALADNFSLDHGGSTLLNGGGGFICAASFVGHLIERDLLSRELARRYLKPLAPGYNGNQRWNGACKGMDPVVRASAIYQLFTTAGNTLLQGLLEPGDVQICFEVLNAQRHGILGPDKNKIVSPKLDVRCSPSLDASH